MTHDAPIRIGYKFSAMVAASLAGVGIYVPIVYISDWVIATTVVSIHGLWPGTPSFGLAIVQLLFGPIFAFPIALVIGLPIWIAADRFLARDRRTATWLGAGVGAAIGCCLYNGQVLPIFGNFINNGYPAGWWGLVPDSSAHRIWTMLMAIIGVGRFALAGMVAARVARRVALH